MRRLLLALALASVSSVHADSLVGYWDLNDTEALSLPTTATLTTSLEGSLDDQIDYGTGTTVNLLPDFQALKSVRFYDLVSLDDFEGKVEIIGINLTGLSKPTISFAIRKNLIVEVFDHFYLEMNAGIGWEFVENISEPTDDYSLRSITIDNPAIAGISNLGLRIVFGADFDFVDVVEVDNVQVNAVPEPSAIMLVAGAALLIGLMAERRRRAAR